jgi:hypothetical protein
MAQHRAGPFPSPRRTEDLHPAFLSSSLFLSPSDVLTSEISDIET